MRNNILSQIYQCRELKSLAVVFVVVPLLLLLFPFDGDSLLSEQRCGCLGRPRNHASRTPSPPPIAALTAAAAPRDTRDMVVVDISLWGLHALQQRNPPSAPRPVNSPPPRPYHHRPRPPSPYSRALNSSSTTNTPPLPHDGDGRVMRSRLLHSGGPSGGWPGPQGVAK